MLEKKKLKNKYLSKIVFCNIFVPANLQKEIVVLAQDRS